MEKNKLYFGECVKLLTDINTLKNPVIVTDPPFNIGYHYSTYKDKMKEEEYYRWLADIVNVGNIGTFVVIHYPESICRLSMELNLCPSRIISWVYNSNTPRQHRDIAFWGITPNFKQVTQPYKNPNDKRIQERIARGIKGGKLYDWFEINQVKNISKEKTAHPCQMPIKVMQNIIGLLPYDCTVIDPFMGSGTTICAVQDMNRIQGCNREYVGIEMDEEYFKIATKRIEENEVYGKQTENS